MALINPCFKDQNWSHLGEETVEKKRRREGEKKKKRKRKKRRGDQAKQAKGTGATPTSRHGSDVHEPRRDA